MNNIDKELSQKNSIVDQHAFYSCSMLLSTYSWFNPQKFGLFFCFSLFLKIDLSLLKKLFCCYFIQADIYFSKPTATIFSTEGWRDAVAPTVSTLSSSGSNPISSDTSRTIIHLFLSLPSSVRGFYLEQIFSRPGLHSQVLQFTHAINSRQSTMFIIFLLQCQNLHFKITTNHNLQKYCNFS